MTADYVLDYCQTPADHPWPRFFISCPTKGKAYGQADPHGFIQLDISAYVGSGMVAAYKVTGNPRYWEAAKHWADLLAEHCDLSPAPSPWPRYANPEDVPVERDTTCRPAASSLVLQFLDDVIRTGYRGKDDSLLKARDAGDKYLRDVLLPEWSRDPHVRPPLLGLGESGLYLRASPASRAQYMMDRREVVSRLEDRRSQHHVAVLLPARASIRIDGRRLLGRLGLSRVQQLLRQVAAVSDRWRLAATFARYAALTDSAWAKEIARRQVILWTYDVHETGVVEDVIDGGVYRRRDLVQSGPSVAAAMRCWITSPGSPN